MSIKTDRRALLRGAAFTGVIGTIGGCDSSQVHSPKESASSEVGPKITIRSIAEAEKLQGISFSVAERGMMLDDIESRLTTLVGLRSMDMPNDLAPAMVFNPKLPRKKISSQKNRLTLSPVSRELPENEIDIAYAGVTELGHWLRNGTLTSVQ